MPTPSQSFLLFEASELCAIPVAAVVRIMARPPIVTIPFSHPPLMGAVNAAGEILPVFDVASLLGTRDPIPADELIVVRGKPDRLGLLVNRVRQTSVLQPAVSAERSSGSALARRRTRWRDRDVTLIDPAVDYLSGSCFHYPDAGADISLGFAVQSLQQIQKVAEPRGRGVLNIGSGHCSFDVPLEMVVGLRSMDAASLAMDRQSAPAASSSSPSVRSKPVISLANLSGAGPSGAEEIGIDVMIASHHATLTVERAARLSREAEIELNLDFIERLRLAVTMEAV